MRFGASCCPSWDPSNWLSRKVPSLLSALWMSRSQNENQKLLRRSASEEEMFQKKPKRKNTINKSENYNINKNGKHQKSDSENNLSTVTATSTVTTVEIVTEGQQNRQKMSSSSTKDKEMLKSISKIGKVMKSKQNNKNSVDSASSSTTSMVSETTSEAISLNPRRRRSRREQAVLAAKSSRGGGRGSYTAANLRRYAAEHKPTSMKHDMLEKRSQSANALKFSPFTAGTIRLFRCIIWLCLFTYLF